MFIVECNSQFKLCKVHVLLRFRVDGNSSVHGGGGAFVGLARLVASLSTVVLLFDQVVSRPEGDEMSIVGRGGDGDRPRAPHVRVAELIRQRLQVSSMIRWTLNAGGRPPVGISAARAELHKMFTLR
jgi:hypothetical protein